MAVFRGIIAINTNKIHGIIAIEVLQTINNQNIKKKASLLFYFWVIDSQVLITFLISHVSRLTPSLFPT